MPDEQVNDAIKSNATGPKRVTADGVTVEQHSIQDQIAAEQHLSSKANAAKGLGFRRVKIVPPGAA